MLSLNQKFSTFTSLCALKLGCIREKTKNILVFPLICTNIMSLRAMKVLMLGKTQNKFWFFARLFVPLQPEKIYCNK